VAAPAENPQNQKRSAAKPGEGQRSATNASEGWRSATNAGEAQRIPAMAGEATGSRHGSGKSGRGRKKRISRRHASARNMLSC
jgi:hypothetical protein